MSVSSSLVLKSEHFILTYFSQDETVWARNVLRSAENYYDIIADRIGIARYGDFWTWDKRTEIMIYPDKRSFLAGTGQPEWSRGSATHHNELVNSHSIKTYKQENVFIDVILPHELTHLMLHDYIRRKAVIPIWFEEGLAQLSEKIEHDRSKVFIKQIIRDNSYLPVDVLANFDIRTVDDEKVVAVFYLQSASIVRFLIDNYGKLKCMELLQHLRSGKDMLTALASVYSSDIRGYQDLEKKWVRYMQTH
jgi:hypothetical protein